MLGQPCLRTKSANLFDFQVNTSVAHRKTHKTKYTMLLYHVKSKARCWDNSLSIALLSQLFGLQAITKFGFKMTEAPLNFDFSILCKFM